jgi:hypothetical protein
MLNAIHDELLEHTSFLGDKEAGSRDNLQIVEMWKYSGVSLSSTSFPNFSDTFTGR